MSAIDLTTLSGAELVELHKAVEKQLPLADYPQLVVETVTEDGETFQAVRCPVCDSIVSHGGEGLYAVDNALRWTSAEFDLEHEDVDLNGENSNYGDTLYYWHATYSEGHAVSLPEGWTEDWS